MTAEIKYKIIDTNILLTDPEKALCSSFRPKEGTTTYLLLPIVVIEELDKFKHEETERGINARQASRILKQLTQKSDTSLSQGIKLEDNYFLRVVTGLEKEMQQQFKKAEEDVRKTCPSKESNTSFDNRILTIAIAYQRKYSNQNCAERTNAKLSEVELITQDTNLAIKANAFGVQANDWEDLHAIKTGANIYKGYKEIMLPGQMYEELTEMIEQELYSKRKITPIKPEELNITACFPNEFFRLINEGNQKQALLAKNNSVYGGVKVFAKCIGNEADEQKITLFQGKYPITGITPRNYQQAFAFEALLDNNIKLVHLIGPAGSGKTLLALAVGLYLHNKDSDLEFLVTKPVVPVGTTLGYLPGTQEEKQMPWMQGINDNLHLLSTGNAKKLFDNGTISVQALETIRGRSIHDGFYIVDEAQNLTPKEVKTIITRMGDTSKIIILGDPYQVDHPALNTFSTGLLHSSERMKEEEISATVYLPKGERSRLATIASEKL